MTDQKIEEPTVLEEQLQETMGEQMEEAFKDDAGPNGSDSPRSVEFILDLPLRVSVELGRTRMMVNDLLQLAQGSIIELDKLAGEALEVLVNNKIIARGEVVSVNDKFGIRVTDIISPTERIEKLG